MKAQFNLHERVLMIAAAVAIGAGIWWAAQAAPQGQCDDTAAVVVATGELQAGTPYPIPTQLTGNVGLVTINGNTAIEPC